MIVYPDKALCIRGTALVVPKAIPTQTSTFRPSKSTFTSVTAHGSSNPINCRYSSRSLHFWLPHFLGYLLYLLTFFQLSFIQIPENQISKVKI